MDVAGLNAKDKARLQKVAEAMATPQGYHVGAAKDFKKLDELGFLMVNTAIPELNGTGNVGIKLSDTGKAAWDAYSAPTGAGGAPGTPGMPAAAGGAAKPKRTRIEIDDDVPMPTGAGVRAARESIYPFDALEIGKSFHVAKTVEMPDPEKALGSSVSAAKRKFSTPLPGQHKTRKGMADNYKLTRNFRMIRVTKDDPKGEGIRVFRVDLPANPNVDGTKGAATA